jgi:DNA-directed RNA polymerase sigma subunit (sigma70/sigma32)
MTQDQGSEQLSEDRRKEIFLALVDAQDHEMDVPQSRKLVVQRFGVSESQVRQIEREGMAEQWPPL